MQQPDANGVLIEEGTVGLRDRFDRAIKYNADTGAALLDKLAVFLGNFVAYPSMHAQAAHVLWVAHTHFMDLWESTPRLAFLSPEPGSGKTRALEATELLVPRPVEAVNVTPAYIFRKVGHNDGRPTILYDEIDTVFGAKAKDNEEIRGLLNAGHRRGAVAGRCVVRGKKIETEEIPAYCAVALAGLGNLPDTILSRAVVIRMKRRSPGERVTAFRRRVHEPAGTALRVRIESWAASMGSQPMTWPEMPPGIEDRDADVWEALIAVADMAGGGWSRRAREAAVALVALSKGSNPSLGVQLLQDIRRVFGSAARMPTEILVQRLCNLLEAPWGDMHGRPINDRTLAKLLRQYDIASTDVRTDSGTKKGYRREDLHDAWERYHQQPAQSLLSLQMSERRPCRPICSDGVAPNRDQNTNNHTSCRPCRPCRASARQ